MKSLDNAKIILPIDIPSGPFYLPDLFTPVETGTGYGRSYPTPPVSQEVTVSGKKWPWPLIIAAALGITLYLNR